MYTYCSQYTVTGRARERKRNGITVDAGCQGNLFPSYWFHSLGMVRLATGYGLDESWLPVHTGTGTRSDVRRGRGAVLPSPLFPQTLHA